METKEMKEWQKGYSLEFLRPYAELFKASNKPHIYGAFGLTKERDVADALAADSLIWWGAPEMPWAAGIAKQLSRDSQHHDFTGRTITIPGGDVLVSSLGYDARRSQAGGLERVVHSLRGLVASAKQGGCVWLEIFQEDKSLVARVKEAGFQYVATKIMAGSEVKGLYAYGTTIEVEHRLRLNPPLPAWESPSLLCLDESFATEAQQAAVFREIADASKFFADHYSTYNKRHSWQALALRGYGDGDPGFIIKPAEMSKDWKEKNAATLARSCEPTELWERMPATVALVNQIPGPKDRVRIMRLRAGDGELARHADITDRDAGCADGKLTRLHIPIVTTKEVEFESWDDQGIRHQKHMSQGGLWYLDQRKPHACKNQGSVDRLHLVADCYGSNEIRTAIARAIGLTLAER